MGPILAAPATLSPPARPLTAVLAALPGLAVRRAVLRERMIASPPAAARGIDAVVRAAANGRSGGAEGALTLASVVAHLAREGAPGVVSTVRKAAAGEGLALVAALLDDTPAHRVIARRGRLPEVCFPERGRLRLLPPGREYLLARPWVYSPEILRLLKHQSPVLIARLLDHPNVRLRHVLEIAARRPTSAPITLALACHDGWFGRPEVRDAIADNPFTPTPVALALLPSVGAATWRRLSAAGEGGPLASAAAALLGLRGV